MKKDMDKIVALCKRRGFIFQDSDIYGGLQGFWDYGPLGTDLKRNVRNVWWEDMISRHDPLDAPPSAPASYQMVGIETTIIMHPQVWKCSGHYDLFVDKMVDCRECKGRFRADHIPHIECPIKPSKTVGQHDKCSLTEPRDFNLMMKTILGALGTEADAAYLRPETAQGIFANFKNVVDSSRVKLPLGICQVGKSFRNEITPRNFTFRSREFEQMEIEFFCHPEQSAQWYTYWRDRRFQWYTDLGIASSNLQLREHAPDELAHYSCGTADIEYAFPFLEPGEFGELEGVAHRGDFDLRSHMEGKLKNENGELSLELDDKGQPKYRGSGKDLTYFDDQTRERFIPHVIEPSAGADRGTLAFLCEAFCEDEAPDDKGVMQTRTLLKLHPRLAPIKAAVFPLVKKDGQPEKAKELYRDLRSAGIATTYDEQAAIGKRYRRQDEIGTPWCITIDGDSLTDNTVTIRDRDTLEQIRLPINEVVDELTRRLRG
ncbi:MAG: glycine--tRNA ligase [Planctomycetaceae bacterium]